METGCQGGQGSPRAIAPGGWMGGYATGRLLLKKKREWLADNIYACVVTTVMDFYDGRKLARLALSRVY